MSLVILSLFTLISTISFLLFCTSKRRKVPSYPASHHGREDTVREEKKEPISTKPPDFEVTPKEPTVEKDKSKSTRKTLQKSLKNKKSGESKSECHTAKPKSKDKSKSRKMKSVVHEGEVIGEKSEEQTDKSKADEIDEKFFKSQRDDDTLRCVRSIAN